MTVSQVILVLASLTLTASVVLAIFRLAKGPTGLDRAVASDVILAILIAAISVHAVWNRTPIALMIILVLSLVGFAAAVALARLITGSSARERRFLEAEARQAYEDAERERERQAPRDRGSEEKA